MIGDVIKKVALLALFAAITTIIACFFYGYLKA